MKFNVCPSGEVALKVVYVRPLYPFPFAHSLLDQSRGRGGEKGESKAEASLGTKIEQFGGGGERERKRM